MTNNIEAIRKYKRLYPSGTNSLIGRRMYDDLIKRGYLYALPKEQIGDSPITIRHLKVTDKFTKFFIDKYSAIDEVFSVYPAYQLSATGSKMMLKFATPDEFADVYWNNIGGLLEEHNEVLEDIVYGAENGYIKGSIKTFIPARAWLDIRKERKASEEHKSVFDVDDEEIQ